LAIALSVHFRTTASDHPFELVSFKFATKGDSLLESVLPTNFELVSFKFATKEDSLPERVLPTNFELVSFKFATKGD